MQPTLRPGQRVLVSTSARRRGALKPGDIIVARHPFRRGVHLVKRIDALVDGRYLLLGDNPRGSSDSRSLGTFSADQLIGPITSVLHEEQS